jgi:multidrug efflux pump subunit AcrB
MRLPRGTDIRAVTERTRDMEALLRAKKGVQNVATYIGSGATRFFLVYDPETRDPTYAQFIVEVDDVNDIDAMLSPLEDELLTRFPGLQWTLSRPNFGHGGGEKIQMRFSGENPAVLRDLSHQVQKILVDDGRMIAIRDNWNQQIPLLSPVLMKTVRVA